MFGSIGGSEFLLIAVLALLLFGPRKLPQIGRSLGRALAEFRGVTREFKSNLEQEVRLEEVRQAGEALEGPSRELQATVARDGTDPGPKRDGMAPVKPANGEQIDQS